MRSFAFFRLCLDRRGALDSGTPRGNFGPAGLPVPEFLRSMYDEGSAVFVIRATFGTIEQLTVGKSGSLPFRRLGQASITLPPARTRSRFSNLLGLEERRQR